MELTNTFVNFFINDGALITPTIRIFIYTSLYLLCVTAPYNFSTGAPIGDSPLQAYNIMKKTEKKYWLLRHKISSFFLLFHNDKLLQIMIKMCHFVWICCIIGFGGVFMRVILALLLFLLAGCNYGVLKLGITHNWYVPVWTIISLVFTTFNEMSVDSFLRDKLEGRIEYRVEIFSPLFDSAFSSKFILSIAFYTLFAAGIAKIRFGGFNWLNPSTLSFYICDQTHLDQLSFSYLRQKLRSFISNFPILITLMATFAIIFEISIILCLFKTNLQFYFVIFAWLFHLSIAILMIPNYIPQCICYLVAIGPQNSNIEITISDLSQFDIIILTITMIIISGYIGSMVFIWEVFPFTNVPMFSRSRINFSHLYIQNENQLNEISWEFPLTRGITTGGEDQFLESDQWIRLVRFSDPNFSIIDSIGDQLCANSHHFWLVLTSALIQTIQSNNSSHLSKFILEVDQLLRDRNLLSNSDYLIFQIHFKSGWKTYSNSSSSLSSSFLSSTSSSLSSSPSSDHSLRK